jgi:hypothetical protein
LTLIAAVIRNAEPNTLHETDLLNPVYTQTRKIYMSPLICLPRFPIHIASASRFSF